MKRNRDGSLLRPLLTGFLAGLFLTLGVVLAVVYMKGGFTGASLRKSTTNQETPSAYGRVGYPEAETMDRAPAGTDSAKRSGDRLNETDHRPTIALVIDDFGNQWDTEAVQGLLHWDHPLTVAVIPGLWASERCARKALEQGKEVILHLPMEPEDDEAPVETFMLRRGMGREDVETLLARGLTTVPGATGLNNHQGSAATADTTAMTALAEAAGARGWYLLDSVTSPKTVMRAMAEQWGIPAMSRDIFLDHTDDPDTIRAALRKAIERAKRTGGPVVVIGHPRRTTWNVLRETIQPGDHDIRWVTLSEAIGKPG
ncbi:hypothetical protein GF324_10925 [bacterium]|nr:hypothetical protein [bacterium]